MRILSFSLIVLCIWGCSLSFDFDRKFQYTPCERFARKMTECMPSYCPANGKPASYNLTLKNEIESHFEYVCETYYSDNKEGLSLINSSECGDISGEFESIKTGKGLFQTKDEFRTLNDLCKYGTGSISKIDCQSICEEINRCFPEYPSENSIAADIETCTQSCFMFDFPGRSFFECFKNTISCEIDMKEKDEDIQSIYEKIFSSNGDISALTRDELSLLKIILDDRNNFDICLGQIDNSGCKEEVATIGGCLRESCNYNDPEDGKPNTCSYTCEDEGHCLFLCIAENECIQEHSDAFRCMMSCAGNDYDDLFANMTPEEAQAMYIDCLKTSEECTEPFETVEEIRNALSELYTCGNGGIEIGISPLESGSFAGEPQGCADYCMSPIEVCSSECNSPAKTSLEMHTSAMQFMSEIECNRLSFMNGYWSDDFGCTSDGNSELRTLIQNVGLYHGMEHLHIYGCATASEGDDICNRACQKSQECDADRTFGDINAVDYFYKECSVRCMYDYVENFDLYNCFAFSEEDEDVCGCDSIYINGPNLTIDDDDIPRQDPPPLDGPPSKR